MPRREDNEFVFSLVNGRNQKTFFWHSVGKSTEAWEIRNGENLKVKGYQNMMVLKENLKRKKKTWKGEIGESLRIGQ